MVVGPPLKLRALQDSVQGPTSRARRTWPRQFEGLGSHAASQTSTLTSNASNSSGYRWSDRYGASETTRIIRSEVLVLAEDLPGCRHHLSQRASQLPFARDGSVCAVACKPWSLGSVMVQDVFKSSLCKPAQLDVCWSTLVL